MTGVHSSSSATSERRSRVLPWPRSPSSTMSWPAISARSTCGITVSANPWRPGHGSIPSRSRARRLSRSSWRRGLSWWPLSRSWPRVLGAGCPSCWIASVTSSTLDPYDNVECARSPGRPLRKSRVQPVAAGQDAAMPLTLLLVVVLVALVAGGAGWSLGRSSVEVPTDGGPALAERDAFIEQLRELAWQHRDVSPELSTIILDEIATRHRRLPGGPNA